VVKAALLPALNEPLVLDEICGRSRAYGLEEINDAFRAAEARDVLTAVVVPA